MTSVLEDWNGLTVETQVGVSELVGSQARWFDVLFDNSDAAHLRPLLAVEAEGVPAYWSVLDETRPYWYVSAKNCYPGNGAMHWRVKVDYTYYDNPLAVPPKVSWRRVTTTEAVDRDVNGDPLLNSSKEPYDPPITEEYHDRVLRIEYNMASFNQAAYDQYIGSINSAAWVPASLTVGETIVTFPKYTVKCLGIDGDPARVGNILFSRVVAEFQIRDDGLDDGGTPAAYPIGWRRRLLDQGFREIVDGQPKAILDAEGNPLTNPVRLDGSGAKLADTADPVWNIYTTKKLKDFGDLGL